MTLKDEEDQASSSSSHSTALTETGSGRSGKTGRSCSRKVSDSAQLSHPSTGPPASHSGQLSHQPSKRSACVSRAVTNERALAGRSSRSAAWGESAYVADTEESELRALWSIIKYAQYQNPKEFDLPKDLMPGIKLPGSYKTLAERKAKTVIELENGLIPRPIRRCFVCSRTCMFAPLLPCDYCSACFHLDCLDPPLPNFPPRSDRWMCPNHVEHIADRYLVRTIRLTERMRIWSELMKVNSSDQPICEFKRPTVKVKREPTEIIDEVTDDQADEDTELVRPDTPPLEVVAPYELTYGPDEEAAVLAALMRKVQRGRAEQSALISSIVGATGSLFDDLCAAPSESHAAVGRRLWRITKTTAMKAREWQTGGNKMRVSVPPAVKAMYARGVRRLPRATDPLEPIEHQRSLKDDDKSLFVRGLLAFYLNGSPQPTGLIDESKTTTSALVHPLSERRQTCSLPKLSSRQHDATSITVSFDQAKEQTNLLDRLRNAKIRLKEYLSGKSEESDLQVLLSLAEQHVNQLTIKSISDAPADTFHPRPSIDTPSVLLLEPDSLRARAVLTPCGGTTGPVVKMCYRQLNVGTSSDCHLCLGNYRISNPTVVCRFGSVHHATIFYDEWTRHFELINYSEYGSRVDGIIYGNDAQPKSIYIPTASTVTDRARQLLRNEFSTESVVPDQLPHASKRPRMVGYLREGHCYTTDRCNCDCTGFEVLSDMERSVSEDQISQTESSDLQLTGWEGSAILRHGSVVQFGCYKFVLSLVDFAPTHRETVNFSYAKEN